MGEKLAFLKVSSQVNNLSSDSGYEKVGYFFLAAIVSTHDNDQLSFLSDGGCSEHGACNKM